MKILHWPTSYPDPEYGLPFNLIFIQEHIKSIKPYHDQVVFYISPNPPKNGKLFQVLRTIESDVPTTRVYFKKTKISIVNRLIVYGLVLSEFIHLRINHFSPDIIHIHIFAAGRLPTFISKLLRIPTVVTEHWTALCRDDVLSESRLKLAKNTYESAAMVLPVCDFLKKNIILRTQAKIKSKIVFNAVDTNIFNFNNNNHIKNNQIITVARLEEAKDIPTLLKAISILDNPKLILKVIGRGNPDELIELSKDLGISEQVEFLGEQPKNVIAQKMRESDVFVLSSLWENSPCVIGEALCCGLPVVVTDVGGVSELFTEEEGRLVLPKDPVSIANGIKYVLNNPENFDREKIAQNAKQRFGYDAIGQQIDEVYREVTHTN